MTFFANADLRSVLLALDANLAAFRFANAASVAGVAGLTISGTIPELNTLTKQKIMRNTTKVGASSEVLNPFASLNKIHVILDTSKLIWTTATKTKSIKAKPLVSLIVDRNILAKFLVDTLEGKEPLKDGAVICMGQSNDAWQQMPKKLLSTYNVIEIDTDGWMVCEPKPDNAVQCYQVPVGSLPSGNSYIIGAYGETLADGTINTQGVTEGDYICRNREDPSDQWVVRKKIFENTYSIKN